MRKPLVNIDRKPNIFHEEKERKKKETKDECALCGCDYLKNQLIPHSNLLVVKVMNMEGQVIPHLLICKSCKTRYEL
jgi:hypothetical protein